MIPSKRIAWALALLVLALAPLPFASAYAGDAIIHLVFGEHAAQGAFFEFNAGETSPGVTSTGYMLLVAALFRVLPAEWVPVAVKLVGLAAWYGLTLCVFALARAWLSSAGWAWAAALACGLLPGSVYNANMGMENGLFAFVVLAWAALAQRSGWLDGRPLPAATDAALGALLGLAFWLRPEGGLVAVLAFAWRAGALARSGGAAALRVLVPGALAAGALVLGFGLFHLAHTGHWLPGSGRARVFLASLKSFHLGPLMIDTRFGARMLYYLPLSALFALGNALLLRRRALGSGSFAAFACATFWIFFALYSFVLGTHHVARYVLFLMPFVVLVAAAAGQCLHRDWSELAPHWARDARWRAATLAALATGLAIVYAVEATLRIDPRSHTAFKLGDADALRSAMHAPARRRAASDAWLELLGRPAKRPVVLALQEVQLRYELDERFVVRSLDGRVDPLMLDFIDGEVVDHPGYLKAREVDFVLDTPVYTHDWRNAWTLWRLDQLRIGQQERHAGLVFTRLRTGNVWKVEREKP